MIVSIDFSLYRDSFGRMILKDREGIVHEGVVPIRAFPIGDPERGISLVDAGGHELVWIDSLSDLPPEMHSIVMEEMDGRELMPEILRIRSVSSFATPCFWKVVTDRGETQLLLKGEEEIRRLSVYSLLVSDSQGIDFLIRDRRSLDSHSRRLLDRFL